MASPAWFFSTLAQATAASIGFVIAFSAALYTSRRARQREIINEFQRDIREYSEEIERPIEEMQDRLRTLGDFETNYDMYSTDGVPVTITREIREWADNQPDSESAFVWANLQWLTSLLHTIQTDTSPEEMSTHLESLEHPVLNAMTSFDTIPEEYSEEPQPFVRLYAEVTEGMNGPPPEYTEDYHIFGTLPELNDFLARNHTTVSTGATMEGWTAAMDLISESYYNINNLQYFDTSLFENDVVGPVLQNCKLLFIIGVILPTLFLLTTPEIASIPSLPAYIITISQVVLLLLTGIYGYNLFNDLIVLVGHTEF